MKTLFPALLAIISLLVTGCTTTISNNKQSSTVCTESRVATTEQEIMSLFDRWNQSLQSGDPEKVVANYAERSILLPTVSNKPRLTPAEKADYFHHFLENQPSGEINMRQIQICGNMAVDTGLYTFNFAKTGNKVRARYSFTYCWDGKQWLIISHHSSAMPEK
ncbi:MAG: SgcJ/EcaC family oxidoreductase [Kiritimatiellae bacterium]|nr:SgcJ/EcaC family oxidoreductase [Kiritimatiellia bacterium]MDD5522027.1 SgcJ/EcaC family oxidoreductase [Kiritimatiellia bacterium]